MNNIVAAQIARKSSNTYLSSKDESMLPAKQQRLLYSHDLSLQPGQEGARSYSNSCSNSKLSNICAKSDKEQRRLCSTKQKQPSLSDKSTRQKKQRYYLQHRSAGQPKLYSRSLQTCVESTLPSPAPSTPQALDTELLSDLCTVGRLSRDIRPVLTKIIFCLHSLHECSFTAVIRADYSRPEFSFG